MTEAVLALNMGSSSLKFALYHRAADDLVLACRGAIENLGSSSHLVARNAEGAVLSDFKWPRDPDLDQTRLLEVVLGLVDEHRGESRLAAIGHRIVHGGPTYQAPVLIDDEVLSSLARLCPLAPLHQPRNLAAVRLARALRPDTPQIACFDTAFHQGREAVTTRFAIPRIWHERGIRRYGFHGLSYEFVARRLRILDPALAAGCSVVAHLGSGASLCALKDGRSRDTTMSFTPLDGLMMAARCGAIDPGVLLYLEQVSGLTPAAVETLLYEKSGLLGVSGLSGDMRVLLASDDQHARDAVDLFAFRVAREAGAMLASMDGLDGVVFTGGIGENAPQVRQAIAKRMAWAGLELDPRPHLRGESRISSDRSRLSAWVIPTDEEAMIARHAADVVPAASRSE